MEWLITFHIFEFGRVFALDREHIGLNRSTFAKLWNFCTFYVPHDSLVQSPKLAKAPQKPPKAPKSPKSAKENLCGGQGPQFDPSEIWVQIGFPWDLGGKVD